MSIFGKKKADAAAQAELENAVPAVVYHDKTAEEVLQAMDATESGLTTAEADKRIAEFGKNALAEGKKKSLLVKFLEQFKDIMIIVLLVAAVVSAVIALVVNSSTRASSCSSSC